MKRTYLIFLSLFFVLIYCLAPLGAADFNQDTLSNKNNFDFDPIHLHIGNIKEGESLVISVTTEDFISEPVTVVVQGQGVYYVWIDHGYGEVTIDDIPAGKYNVIAYVQGNRENDDTATFYVL